MRNYSCTQWYNPLFLPFVFHSLLTLIFLFTFQILVAQPVITSFSPRSAPAGTTLTISGNNFSTTPGNNIVYFGSVRAVVSSASSINLTVVIPFGATYSPISVTTVNLTAYSSQPFIITGSLGCGGNPFSFTNSITLGATSYPRHISAGDIDGDGKPEMVVVNNTGASFSVFKNLSSPGSLNLSPQVDFATGNNVFACYLGDLDGDGKLDVVTTNYSDNNVSVFRNTSTIGVISFEPRMNFATALSPLSVVIADFDRDGKPDIAVTNNNSNSISVLKNIGNSSIDFAGKVDFQVGLWPNGIAAGDLDSDGFTDLAITNLDANTVSILRNTNISGISFAPKVDYPTQARPFGVAIGDINADGKCEVAVTNSNSNSVSIYPNFSSPGAINLNAAVSYNTGLQPLWISFADLNGDLKPDMQVVEFADHKIKIFQNNSLAAGSPSFAVAGITTTGSYPRCAALADIDSDGRIDVCVVESVANTISIKWNIANSNIIITTSISPVTCTNWGSIDAFADNGQSPYTYSLDGNLYQSTGNFAGLTAGSYLVYVKDALGCINTKSVLVTNQPGPQITTVAQAASCNNLGSFLATGSGGVSPYYYSIDGVNYQSTGFFNNLNAGTYNVIVKDASGCLDTTQSIIPPFSLSVNVSITPSSCNNSNGSIILNGVGGTSPYTFSIDGINYQPPNSFNALAPGNYTVFIKDFSQCIRSSNINVSSVCLAINLTASPTTCSSVSNGSINVSVSNGIPPYNFSLDGVNFQFAPVFSNLQPGNYTITVRDATGVIGSATTTVETGTTLQPTAIFTPSSCLNNDGKIIVNTITGRQLQYSLDGINYQGGNIFSGLSAGLYNISVKDISGCIGSTVVTVTTLNDLVVNQMNDITICQGNSMVLPAQSNGTTYLWSPSSGLSNPAILQPGASPINTTTYRLIVRRGNCVDSTFVKVKVNPAPTPHAGKDTLICLGKNIQLIGSGGVNYKWSPSVWLNDPTSATPLAIDPPPGLKTFALHVTDTNGCNSIIADSVTVNVVQVKISLGNDTIIASNQSLQLSVVDVNSSGITNYSWSPSQGLSQINIANPVATPGTSITYLVKVQTIEGCQGADEIQVKLYDGPEIYVPNSFTPNGDGLNDQLKAIPVGLKSFSNFTVYNRWGNAVFSTTQSNIGWNGKSNGIVQYGVFVWLAQGTDYFGNKVFRKGTVLVL